MIKNFLVVIAIISLTSCMSRFDRADKYIGQGMDMKKKGDYRGALNYYTKAIKLNTTATALHYALRGTIKIDNLKDIDGGLADLNEAIRLDPTEDFAYFHRGKAKKEKGDIDGAILDYDEAIRLNPRNGLTYAFRGNVKEAKGDIDGALADYNEAIRIDPRDGLAYSYRSSVKKAKGDIDGALADYIKAIRLNQKKRARDLGYPRPANVSYYKGMDISYFKNQMLFVPKLSPGKTLEVKLKEGTFIFINGKLQSWELNK